MTGSRSRFVAERAGRLRRLSAGSRPCGLEALEARALFDAFHWSAEEVYMLELVNRAREDPAAEGVRYSVDLTEGLTAGELARLHPSEPLALNSHLTLAARAQALDMATRLFFDHVNPDGQNPTDRAQANGYAGTAGENIAAGYEDVEASHVAWLESLGHRKNVLSLHSTFTSSFHYDEFGYGYAFTASGQYHRYYAQSFGYQGPDPNTYVLGVVYRDSDGDDFYTMGEGSTGIVVDVYLQEDPTIVVGSYETDAAGNYQIVVNPGDYILRFTDSSNGKISTRPLTIGSVNVKEDADPADFVEPDDPGVVTDDHRNFGAYADATVISLDSHGDGLMTARLSPATDTDFFRFTPTAGGLYTITVTTPGSSLNPRASLYNGAGQRLAQGVNSGTSGDEWTISYNVVADETYYINVESQDGTTLGTYALSVEAPITDPGDGDPGDGDPGDPVNPFKVDPTAAALATSNSAGRITVVSRTETDRPLVFQQNGSTWMSVDLLEVAGGTPVIGQIITFVDPKDGLTYAAAPSSDGLLLYRQALDGTWTVRNLTAEIDGSVGLAGSLTVFVSLGRIAHIAGVDAGGNIVMYRQAFNQADGAASYTWTFMDIAADLASQGMTAPAFTGPLISYVTRWNGLNIAGLDANGDVHTVWWAPGMALWRTSNLSDTTGAAPIAGGLTVYLTRWGGINLAGADGAGKVAVTWWVPGFGGAWRKNNLTNESSGPVLNADSMSSYVTRWGGLNIAGTRSDGELVIYWWVPGFARWRVTAISTAVVGDELPTGPVSGHATATGVLNLFGISADGDVVRYSWRPGETIWQFENLTDILSAVV